MLGNIKLLKKRQVPVILQMSRMECGAACLSMIFQYHKLSISLTKCRDIIGSGRDGVSALELKSAAEKNGLAVGAYRVDWDELQLITEPAIAHWNTSHFVIIEKVFTDHAQIVDPAIGRIKLSRTEFLSRFSDIILTFTPTEQIQEITSNVFSKWGSFLRLFLKSSSTRTLLKIIVLSSIALQLFGLVLPLFSKILFDYILPAQSISVMYLFLIMSVTMIIGESVLNYFRSMILLKVQYQIDKDLITHFFEHLLSLRISFFYKRTTGDLLLRLSSNSVLREIITGQVMSLFMDLALVLIYSGILVFLHPVFALITFFIGLIQAIILISCADEMHSLTQQLLSLKSKTQTHLHETIRGILTIKALANEKNTFDTWYELYENEIDKSIQTDRFSIKIKFMTDGLQKLAPIIFLGLGGAYLLQGQLSLGTVLMLNSIGLSILAPLSSLIGNAQKLQVADAYLERLTDVQEEKREFDRAITQEIQSGTSKRLKGDIKFVNVSFRYDQHGELLLKNINLSIKSGQKVAFVGSTGSGKSTLALLIMAIFQPSEGQILFDDKSGAEYDTGYLRQNIGAVLQKIELFSGTIYQNISLFSDFSQQSVEAVARKAVIHDDILAMPMGYDTLLSEGGNGLSGGQQQRLALARALINQPSIIVMDEATSHLDVMTESLIDEQLGELNCTRIIIAHRLSTILDADQIFVLEDGEITASGKHDELLASSENYMEMISKQFISEKSQ